MAALLENHSRNDSPLLPVPASLVAKPSVHTCNIDGGWAWIVLSSSFAIHVIVFGTTFSMGIFFSEFLDEFERGPVATSWLIAVNCGLSAMTGEAYP